MTIHARLVLAALFVISPLLPAQTVSSPLPSANQPADQESFLVTLTMKTTDHGKKSTDQSYTLGVMTHAGSSNVREGDKIPIVSSSDTHADQVQYQYIDLGTNIDLVNVKRMGSLVAIDIKVEVSSADIEPAGKLGPTIRQAKYSINPVVPLGKAITVYSSADAVSGRKVEIQVLIEPIPGS